MADGWLERPLRIGRSSARAVASVTGIATTAQRLSAGENIPISYSGPKLLAIPWLRTFTGVEMAILLASSAECPAFIWPSAPRRIEG